MSRTQVLLTYSILLSTAILDQQTIVRRIQSVTILIESRVGKELIFFFLVLGNIICIHNKIWMYIYPPSVLSNFPYVLPTCLIPIHFFLISPQVQWVVPWMDGDGWATGEWGYRRLNTGPYTGRAEAPPQTSWCGWWCLLFVLWERLFLNWPWSSCLSLLGALMFKFN